MGKQYIKTLLKAILPGKYHCIPHRTRSDVKEYGLYRRQTKKQEQEDRKKDRQSEVERKQSEKERKELEKERREWENELDKTTKQRQTELKKKREEMKKQIEKERENESDKEEEEEMNKMKEKEKKREKENKNDKEPIKESDDQSMDENKKLKNKKRRKDEKSDKPTKEKNKRQSKEKEDMNEKRISKESHGRESKHIDNETKKIVVKTEMEDSKVKQCELSFEIANIVDNGYPSKPIIVVLQMKKVCKDEDDKGNTSNPNSQEYRRYSESDCGSDKCLARRNDSNSPVTKADLKRIEKIAIEYLRDSDTPTYSSSKKNRKRQESGQSSRTNIALQAWQTRGAQYSVRSIAMLKQNYGKHDEQQKLVSSDDQWTLKESSTTHFKERRRDSDEFISIGEYWEFISDQNMTGCDNESRGTSIIIEEEYTPNEAVDDTNKAEKDIHQNKQLPIWSKVRYNQLKRPTSTIQQKQSPCGEFYRLDMPVCLSKNKCQYCREYEMVKQGQEVNTFPENDNTESKTTVNPKCIEYCTVMDMLDQANI